GAKAALAHLCIVYPGCRDYCPDDRCGFNIISPLMGHALAPLPAGPSRRPTPASSSATITVRRWPASISRGTRPTWHLPMQLRDEDCVTRTNDSFDFVRSIGEYQCPTRSKLRRSESAASMQYRC